MLEITIPAMDYFDESTETFIATKEQTLRLEHSLIAISKWESKWHKPFLTKTPHTDEETRDYVRCMTISTHPVDPLVYLAISPENIKKINDYIEDPMTATWITEREGHRGRHSSEIITSELIYYWMISLEIPVEFEKWHLNRLLTLVRVCNAKNAPAQKMSKGDIYKRNRNLNAARKAKLHTHG